MSNIDTTTNILGKHYKIPIAIAPTAYQKLAGGHGEIHVARAAKALGTNLILSTSATTSLEDVAAALTPRGPDEPGPWFQLYFLKSRTMTADLVQRAEKAGYEALVFTVDTVVLGNRLRQQGKPLQLPAGVTTPNIPINRGASSGTRGDSGVDSSLQWDEVIPWLRSKTSMKIILKGILTQEDARRAVAAGVDAIVVSNHGGRQLDGVPATLEALPEVVEAVGGKIPVIFDGGISRGSDVFKALALGADLCLIGRTALWGLAWDGQKGVEGALKILEGELLRTMALIGVARLGDISRGLLGRRRRNGFGIEKL